MVEWCQWLYYKTISPLCKRLLGRFTPNQITTFNLLFTLIAGTYFFSRGTYSGNLYGLGVLLINGILDYVDGDIAKSTNQISLLGAWLDKGGDVLIQTVIMATIVYALLIQYFCPFLLFLVVVYFIGTNASNMISIYYNHTFDFDSHAGNEFFRQYMDYKKDKRDTSMIPVCQTTFQDIFNGYIKNLIDPTSSLLGLILWTVRYYLVFGIIFNQMLLAFILITLSVTIRWIALFVLYSLHLGNYKHLWVLKALSAMDETHPDYYKSRGQN